MAQYWVLPKGGRADVCLGAAVRLWGEYPGCMVWGMAHHGLPSRWRWSSPGQSFLLDRYHLLEHLHEGASLLVEGAKTCPRLDRKAWVNEQVSRIDQGRASEVVAECRSQPGVGEEHPLEQLAGYLESRLEQLDYAAARKEGLPLGSGAVEGGHRHVIQARLKLPGAWWKEETLNPMLALRTLRSNGQWEAFWN